MRILQVNHTIAAVERPMSLGIYTTPIEREGFRLGWWWSVREVIARM